MSETKRVLLVDGETGNLMALSSSLSCMGLEVQICNCPDLARTSIRHSETFDCVVIDSSLSRDAKWQFIQEITESNPQMHSFVWNGLAGGLKDARLWADEIETCHTNTSDSMQHLKGPALGFSRPSRAGGRNSMHKKQMRMQPGFSTPHSGRPE